MLSTKFGEIYQFVADLAVPTKHSNYASRCIEKLQEKYAPMFTEISPHAYE
jgi:hypothetical protein